MGLNEKRICYCWSCRAETEQHGSGFCARCYREEYDHQFLPMDRVRHVATGEVLYVNSAHYLDFASGTARQMFSVCRQLEPGEKHPGKLYYADECELMHRHVFRPYKGIRRCDCGEVFTTGADCMVPADGVTRH
ncbi:hypothetical protein [Burkholderia cenocepacia]|uniref:hypothetical protein n=1 Tax=Burkholderia cenocepacia TaxID=95486 RepID=UPI00158BFD2D|nr:hypothetical protein [Burkholderia cenocepacia]